MREERERENYRDIEREDVWARQKEGRKSLKKRETKNERAMENNPGLETGPRFWSL